ncbi:MAG: amidase [Myxococcota bacterium]|nr:amidase [Myxococcota bacterium]
MAFSDYDQHDAVGLAELVAQGEVSPEELLDEALTRMGHLNPTLNAVVIPMEEEARGTLAAGLPKGPLSGVPFLLKDLALNYAGVRTTHGCRIFAESIPERDSELTRRYRAAGLVVFGKSASPEFGLTTTTESLLFGQTRNPWNLEHVAGGSSGGAAAAVAAGMLPLAHASDGGGSIRIPAACCGLFGLKPSRGRMPFGPDVGEGWSGMSTMHAVSRSIRDSATLLDASDGADIGAPYPAPPKARPYREEIDREPAPLRIALLEETFNGLPTDPDCLDAVRDAAKLCETLGHHVELAKFSIDTQALATSTQTIMGGNVASLLDDRAAALGRELREDDMEPFTWTILQGVRERSAADYARAIRGVHAVGRQVENFLQSFDMILSPTMGAPPEKLGVLALSNPDLPTLVTRLMTSVGYTQIFNASGHPAMSVPLFWNSEGLPIGIQFAARLGQEGTLFRLAGQLEKARPWAARRPPTN